jgi:hypothetical protein
MNDKIFAKGIYFSLPNDKAPDYVKGKLSVKVADAIEFLKEYENKAGYVNFDLKVSQSGKAYVELDTYQSIKPEATERVVQSTPPSLATIEYPEDINSEDIPF